MSSPATTSRARAGAPLVSVVMATYNFERFVTRAIDSALAQDYPADALEVIVVDDGSTDRTSELVRAYGDRVRYIRKPNEGLRSTVNRGLAECSGEYISLLSGDDLFPPEKTRRQVDFMLSNPDVGLVYGDLELIDDLDRPLGRTLWQTYGVVPRRGRVHGSLLANNFVSGGALMVRGSLKPLFHPLPPSVAWEDWYIALRVAEVAELDYLPDSVYRYRYHGENMNLGAGGAKRATLLVEEIRFRRWLLSSTTGEDVATGDLLAAFEAFECIEAELASLGGGAGDRRVAIEPEDRARALELAQAAATLDRPECLAKLINAFGHDPSNDQIRAAIRAEAAASPGPLAETRAVSLLAYASELADNPEMLSAYARNVTASDDATLVVCATADTATVELGRLAEQLEQLGLASDDGPDLLALPLPGGNADALAPHVRAVYSRARQSGALANRPRIDDGRSDELRSLLADVRPGDAAGSR